MPKPHNKSSATSATRKKHAKKATDGGGPSADAKAQTQPPKAKGKKDKKSKEPRKKVYIPPTKPKPIRQDPLDTLGLASILPPELVVLLRKLAKKDTTTKVKAVEEFKSTYLKGEVADSEADLNTLIIIAPVWLFHYPSLILHSSRRLRALAASVHASLSKNETLSEIFSAHMLQTDDDTQVGMVLGSGCMAAFDEDRHTAAASHPNLDTLLSYASEYVMESLWYFLEIIIFDPADVQVQMYGPLRSTEAAYGSTVQTDDDAEDMRSRNARWRSDALKVLSWILESDALLAIPNERIPGILGNPALFSSLQSSKEESDRREPLGVDFPRVRIAGWHLLQIIMERHSKLVTDNIDTISRSVLLSAWVEPDQLVRSAMWRPLLLLLTTHPRVWSPSSTADDDDDDDGEDPPDSIDKPTGELAYNCFLSFLQNAARGSYQDGYPTVLVVLSTIPSEILPPTSEALTQLFNAFRSAHEDGYLITPVASHSFLSAFLECLTFVAKSLKRDGLLDDSTNEVIQAQWTFVWRILLTKELVIKPSDASKALARTLDSLATTDEDTFRLAWATVLQLDAEGLVNQHLVTAIPLLSRLAHALSSTGKPKQSLDELIQIQIQKSLEGLISSLKETESNLGSTPSTFELLISEFFDVLKRNDELLKRWENTLQSELSLIISRYPTLPLTYLARVSDTSTSSGLWDGMLKVANDLYCNGQEQMALRMISTIIEALDSKKISNGTRPSKENLPELLDFVYAKALADDKEARNLLVQILRFNACFTSRAGALVSSILDTLRLQLLQAPYVVSTSLPNLSSGLKIVHDLFDARSELLQPSMVSPLTSGIYFLAFIEGSGFARDLSRRLWIDFGSRQLIDKTGLVTSMCEWILDTKAHISANELATSILEKRGDLSLDALEDGLVNPLFLDETVNTLTRTPVSFALGVLDPFLVADSIESESGTTAYDEWGFCSYTRCVSLVISWSSIHRRSLQRHPSLLRHVMLVARQASDLLALPNSACPMFKNASPVPLQSIVREAEKLYIAFFNFDYDTTWHNDCASILFEESIQSSDIWAQHLQICFHESLTSNTPQDAWVLYLTLKLIISEAPQEVSEIWLPIARKTASKSSETARAIYCSVARFGMHCQQLDRLRNQIASDITAIHVSNAATKGNDLLKQLVALAPDAASEYALVGAQRAVFLVQHLEKWALSDEEDMSQETQALITAIFQHLVPLLQGVSGGHWDFVCDILESNLEECSLEDESSLFALFNSFNLILQLEDLSSSNISLRGYWEPRRGPILKQAGELIMRPQAIAATSKPLERCQRQALRVAQLIPSSSLKQDQLAPLSSWLLQREGEVLVLSYPILQQTAKAHTEFTVLHFAVEQEENDPEFPEAIMRLLQYSPPTYAGDDSSTMSALGYLLAWMITLDLLSDASLRVKKAYLAALQIKNVIRDGLIPFIISSLRISGTGKSPLRIDLWQVDEFYVDLIDVHGDQTVNLLAAHVFHRILSTCPTLIRAWWLGCTDRRLSTTISSFVTAHYSRSLIQQELSVLQDPDVVKEILLVENFSIRVLSPLKEIHTTYLIDDQNMEVALKLPDDFPLHGVAVNGVHKVGVSEEKWRAWLLGLQQVINSQNGQIKDGIQMFSKNVSLHFEGQPECAICYSIISVSDRSLPTSPCRTCKNRFHGSCLFKWFKTSHSSACPLCRSEII